MDLYKALFNGLRKQMKMHEAYSTDGKNYKRYVSRFLKKLGEGKGATYGGVKIPPLKAKSKGY